MTFRIFESVGNPLGRRAIGAAVLLLLLPAVASSTMSPQCVPQGTVASATSSYASSPANAIDCVFDNRDNMWNAGGHTGALFLDFPEPFLYQGIRVTANALPTTNETYTVYVSSGLIASATAEISSVGVTHLDIFFPVPTADTSLSIEVDGGPSWVAINEVRVYAVPLECVPEGTIASADRAYAPASQAIDCIFDDRDNGWNAGDHSGTLSLDFPSPGAYAGIRITANALPSTNETYTVSNSSETLATVTAFIDSGRPVSVCATANENSLATLGCAAGSTITSIDFASYGTPSGLCPSFSQSSCHASTSRAVVEAACLGQESCSILASNPVFGDPCFGTVKRLYVVGSCTPNVEVTDVDIFFSSVTTDTRLSIAVDGGASWAAINEVRLYAVQDVTPPVAEAGQNQAAHVGQVVGLDGSGSYDDRSASQDLDYAWAIDSAPAGSVSSLSGADTVAPTLLVDVVGDFVISLVVTDEAGLSSAPDSVLVSSLNTPPNADAGIDQSVVVGTTVYLDGSASFDPDFDPIVSYAWTLASQPAGSAAALSGAGSAIASLTPDVPGIYDAQLVVGDGYASSAPDSVTIVVISAQEYAQLLTGDALNLVVALPSGSVSTGGNQTALGNFLSQAIAALQGGDLADALLKLGQAIERTDGCALRGTPDSAGNSGGGGGKKSSGGGGPFPMQDYITKCADQAPVYDALVAARAALQ